MNYILNKTDNESRVFDFIVLATVLIIGILLLIFLALVLKHS